MTDRFNTIAGWVLASGIVALGLSSVSSHVFRADSHEGPEVAGYPVEAADEGGGADQGPDLGTLLAAADPAAGEKIFAKCTSCHTIEQGGANGIGPNLYGTVGEPIGQGKAGYAFSSALSGHGGNWTYENLDAWLTSPKAFAPGTKMSFAGLGKPEDRANVIAYLKANGGGPDYPAPAAAPAEGDAAAAGEEAITADVEGSAVEPVEAADATGMQKPVPEQVGATTNP
ncbi:c-type cytochrome [Croceibacterium aestuarii]|uniref:c-type cytochrome n=1 Tax=Croceibacterium aestuarii TaxID=3064139 RepID=UPI00272E473B|nr:cytochrome c family protein [Croceibacterium sp. D39]